MAKKRPASSTTTTRTRKSSSSPTDATTDYARAVVAKKIVAGPLVRLACERHLRDLREGPLRGLRWDVEAAARVQRFFPAVLRLAEGEHAGQPFVLQTWQQFIVGSLFGWLSADGFRRFRLAYVEVGKGNGKSPLAGGIGLYMMLCDGEQGAHCFAAAPTRDQAGIMFMDAVHMVEASPALARRVLKSGKRTVYNLAHLATGSFFRPVSSEGRALDGKRVHYAGIDEIHEHATPVVVTKMRAGTKGRRQALIFEITNSGFDRTSICWEHHSYSERILHGQESNDAWFGYVSGLDKGDDWQDERVWLKANPNLGVSISLKYLREQVAEAVGMPINANKVRRLNFCEWTEAEGAPFEPAVWEAAQSDELDLRSFRGRRCWGGIDLSSKNDLTALAVVFEKDDGGLAAFCWYWTPGATLKDRERSDKVPYQHWRDAGHLIAVPGRSIDYAVVATVLRELRDHHELVELAYDRWRIDDLLRELEEAGIDAVIQTDKPPRFGGSIILVPHGQGFRDMGPAVDLFDTAIRNGNLLIKRNPVTTMCASNAVQEQDAAGNKKYDKRHSTGRIDGMIALTMAVGRAMKARNEDAKIGDWIGFMRDKMTKQNAGGAT